MTIKILDCCGLYFLFILHLLPAVRLRCCIATAVFSPYLRTTYGSYDYRYLGPLFVILIVVVVHSFTFNLKCRDATRSITAAGPAAVSTGETAFGPLLESWYLWMISFFFLYTVNDLSLSTRRILCALKKRVPPEVKRIYIYDVLPPILHWASCTIRLHRRAYVFCISSSMDGC